MTILRQYSLPNCKLILQGLGDPAVPLDPIRPLLSVLVNAECHFSGYEQPIQGGREFFENLAACVSQYAQEFLSSIQHPIAQGIVQLQKLDANHHRLTVLPQTDGQQAQAIDLGTVQLFDLVEAIDQFVADPQTLPDFKLGLAPLSKRYVASSEPIAQRAAPVAIGLSSLAAAAALLFFIPIPEVRRPEPAGANGSPDAVSASPTPATAAGSPPEIAASPTDPPTASETPSPSPTTSPIAAASPGATPSEAEVTALLNNTPEITDPETIRQLKLSLRDQLDREWTQQPPAFDEPLEYRVAVSREGDILGFKFVNDASIAHVRETPLLDKSYQPIDPNAPNREPIAQMRVVFTPNGVVQVSPWHGKPNS
ncbi:DUF4335 domain-containing protein [Microcoleus sp. FACHB-1515]|uniref:DUF4335 domain-containing protein n=1 Tax=Cyanophyceae TaxID=3028117 RepID=UPI0016874707|nr:DUF4335 domain-containing protein [Microcoleus sp. FACHB-1515]MBD2093092.1 DUF4335 domain-containing protein [Microcoleus sp. FACHB-1515]